MCRFCTGFAALVACGIIAVLAVVPVSASVVTVSPGDMHGWITATNTTGLIAFSTALPRSAAPPSQPPAAAAPKPPGALWGGTGGGGRGWGQVWAGTDQFLGVPLSQITKLSYSTYSAGLGAPDTGDIDIDRGYGYSVQDPYEDAVYYWHYPKQPWQITLIVQKSATNTAKRTLLYKPWTNGVNGVMGDWDYTDNPYNQWVTHNAMTDGKWCVAQPIGNPADPPHYYPNGWVGTWSQIFEPVASGGAGLSGAVICEASTWSPTWDDPTGTANGCSFNLEAGSRIWASHATNLWGVSGYGWWTDSYNYGGYVDNVTIGVNGSDTTFDFEAAPNAGINGSAARDWVVEAAEEGHRFTAWGRVALLAPATRDAFLIDDGSGKQIKVISPNYPTFLPIVAGTYVRACGNLIIDGETGMPVLTCLTDVTVLAP